MNVKNIEKNGNQATIVVEIDKELLERCRFPGRQRCPAGERCKQGISEGPQEYPDSRLQKG